MKKIVFSPYKWTTKVKLPEYNYKRVAAVWMDEYAEFIYKRRPHYRDMDPGDISAQLELRRKLQCKPFKWFMKEVAFDLPRHYPPVEPEDFVSGEIRSVAEPGVCVDTGFKRQGETFGLEKCMKGRAGASGEQKFSLTWRKVSKKTVNTTVLFQLSTACVARISGPSLGGRCAGT